MSFTLFSLSQETLKALDEAGYTTPTPIQDQVIPHVLGGLDVFGCAQTGTGKTASYLLPLLERLKKGRVRARMPRVLILTPTRELALQVEESAKQLGQYHKVGVVSVIGGESMVLQEKALEKSVDFLIATPGRLLDIIARGRLLLNAVEALVIDEADRLLDMGFIPDVEKIMSFLPPARQTLLFSATVTPEVRRLSQSYLKSPKEVTITPEAVSASTISQHVIEVDARSKRKALRQYLTEHKVDRAILFCNRKVEVSRLCESLKRHNYNAAQIHGDLSQSERKQVLESFHKGDIAFLVASDVAARGIDVDQLPFVFNFEVPKNPEEYVHRIGRTGRAGNTGTAVTFVSPSEKRDLAAVEKYTSHKIEKSSFKEEKKTRGKTAERSSKVIDIVDEAQEATLEQAIAPKTLPQKTENTKPTRKPYERRQRQVVLGFGKDVPAFFLLRFNEE